MKELAQWSVFAGAGVVLFLIGLVSAWEERKAASRPGSPTGSEHNPPALHSESYVVSVVSHDK